MLQGQLRPWQIHAVSSRASSCPSDVRGWERQEAAGLSAALGELGRRSEGVRDGHARLEVSGGMEGKSELQIQI